MPTNDSGGAGLECPLPGRTMDKAGILSQRGLCKPAFVRGVRGRARSADLVGKRSSRWLLPRSPRCYPPGRMGPDWKSEKLPHFRATELRFGPMVPARVRLGELLVEAQIVSRAQLEEVLASQKRDGRRIGTLLVEAGLVTETQVTQILSQQLSVPWVSLYHIDFSRQLLNLVSHQLAEKYCLVPIFVRRVRGLGETLYVAMDDPSDEAAQRDVGQWAGLPVRAMIAPPTDIRSAIRVYYGVGKDTASLSEAVAEVDAETAAGERLQSSAPTADDDTPPSSERTPIPSKLH